ncbi:MAG: hypothetical protein J2P58_05770 [Acidimicrobiaceae bacterium]|nr:hypothetical protein [Acidimicrobiaceae bacterium]
MTPLTRYRPEAPEAPVQPARTGPSGFGRAAASEEQFKRLMAGEVEVPKTAPDDLYAPLQTPPPVMTAAEAERTIGPIMIGSTKSVILPRTSDRTLRTAPAVEICSAPDCAELRRVTGSGRVLDVCRRHGNSRRNERRKAARQAASAARREARAA